VDNQRRQLRQSRDEHGWQIVEESGEYVLEYVPEDDPSHPGIGSLCPQSSGAWTA
jgi:hypothetical protein